jgi:co-chaperonin GroES (HSP10)
MGKILREFEPFAHRVLVKLIKPKEDKEIKTDWGFVTEIKKEELLERERYATQEAIVMKIGYNAFKDYGDGRNWCEIGDRVLIVKYSGEDRNDIEEGEIYRAINEIDMIGKFQGE